MGIFQQFPYSNFHEFNLDQIIKIMKEMQDEWNATKTEWTSYKEFIDNYFENLDLDEETEKALRVLVADGTLSPVIDPVIAAVVAAWLAEHITQPTTPAIDTSLTIAGAAADAKATGDADAALQDEIDKIIDDLYMLESLSLTDGAFINLGVGIGNTVSLTPTNNAGYGYLIIDVDPGDVFILSAKGGNNSRAWGFIDASNKLLSCAGAGEYVNNVTLTASAAGKLIVNSYLYDIITYPFSLEKNICRLDKTYPIKINTWNNGAYINTGGTSIGSVVNLTPTEFASYSYMVIDCNEGDVFRITGRGGQASRLWAFIDTNNVLVSIANGGITVTDLYLTAPVTGKVIINCYNLIEHLVYTFKTQEQTITYLTDAINNKIWDSRNWEFVIPDTLRVASGIEMNIYHNNVCRYVDTREMQIVEMTNNNLENYNEFSRYNGTQGTSDFDTQVKIYANDTHDYFMESDEITVHTVSSSAGSGTTKKVLLIGDSLTDGDATSGELVDMFSTDVMNIELIGTLGTAPNLNEGRAGWRAYTYALCANGAADQPGLGYTNPFYNPNTGRFDFNYYMTQNGFSGVDYVFICLGTNDIGRSDHNTDSDIINYYNMMIESIQSYNSNIVIGLWLPPTRALYANTNRRGIDASLRANKLLIDTYSNRETDKIYLIPVYLNVDPEHDYMSNVVPVSSRNSNYTMVITTDPVHPSVIGYKKIADVIFSYIKFFAE